MLCSVRMARVSEFVTWSRVEGRDCKRRVLKSSVEVVKILRAA